MAADDPMGPFLEALMMTGTVRGACSAGGFAEHAVKERLTADPEFRKVFSAALEAYHSRHGVAVLVEIPDNGRDPAPTSDAPQRRPEKGPAHDRLRRGR